MKLGDYLPEVPEMAKQMGQLGSQMEIFNELMLSKSAGDTGSGPTFGVDYIVNSYIRNQLAYRKQLVQDLQTIAYTCEELRAPIMHITGEVFRRGIKIEPIVTDPDKSQIKRLQSFMDDCNLFDQGLEEVLRQFHWDLNTVDDAFLYFAKEYYDAGDGKLNSRVTEIRRINPALIEYDLDETGLPKNSHFFCPLHRQHISESPEECSEEGFLDTEVVHLSKFNPTETYGWSPVLTIFEKALTLIGMDRNLYRYFFERKMPASMVMVTTDDPESLKREREAIAAKVRQDPNYIPMVAVSSRTNRGRVDMVRMFHTLQEMDYLPVRAEIRERVSAIYGVSPVFQGAPDSFGGLSQQTTQLTVMSRVVERDQRQIMEKVFTAILDNFGVTDYKLVLPNPEEKAEATRISHAQQRTGIANQLLQMGFDVELKDDKVDLMEVDFIISGEPVPSTQMQGEMTAIQLDQQQQQAAIQEAQATAQMEQGESQATQGEGEETEKSLEKNVLNSDVRSQPLQQPFANMNTAVPKGKGKFQGRTAGRTPDHNDKTPLEERDIEEYAETREKKFEDRMYGLAKATSTWTDSLADQGYDYPIIKEVSLDGSQLWFISNGVDYIGNLEANGVSNISKASFSGMEGKKYYGDQYQTERGDGSSRKNEPVNVEEEDDDG